MALTGALVDSVCYQSQAAAADAYFSKIPPSVTSGTTSYQTQYVKNATTGAWQIQSSTISNKGVVTITGTTAFTPPAFPACDPALGWQDGMAFAMIVVGVIGSSVLFSLISRAR